MIPFIKPNFPNPKLIADDLDKIYQNNYYSNNGPFYHKFKQSLEGYLGQDLHCVIVSNATQALLMSIQTIFKSPAQIKRKKYIAIPSFTFAAAPHAIRWCGFEPIFFDINSNDAQPSLSSFKEVVAEYGHDLVGVILINNFGIGNEDIDIWDKYLKNIKLPYIVDSAPGFGSTYNSDRLLGGYGECEIFSFHATKPFGIGEGGLITTKNKDLADRFEKIKNFSFDEKRDIHELGTNAKITELDCAIGLRVLEKYQTTLESRRESYAYYESKLSGKVSFLPRAATAAIQFASIITDTSKQRENILDRLHKEKIEARTYYAPAVHTFSFFNAAKKVNLYNTELLSSRILSLPIHPDMSKVLIDRICNVIIEEL